MNIHSLDEIELKTLLSLLDRFRTEQCHFTPYDTYRTKASDNHGVESKWQELKQLLDERKKVVEKRLSTLTKMKSPKVSINTIYLVNFQQSIHHKLKSIFEIFSKALRDLKSKSSVNVKLIETQLSERCSLFSEVLVGMETVNFIGEELATDIRKLTQLFCDYISQVIDRFYIELIYIYIYNRC